MKILPPETSNGRARERPSLPQQKKAVECVNVYICDDGMLGVTAEFRRGDPGKKGFIEKMLFV
jgi:hypothetical protein